MGTCMRCGKCCTSFGVCITPFDIVRIARETGKNPLEFATAMPEPPERERTEPAVLINGVRSLIVLKWKDARGKRICPFYSAEGCVIYATRPLLCRTYPFVLRQNELAEADSRSCPLRWKPDGGSYRKDLDSYAKELEEYRAIAGEWNSCKGGSLEEFLRFASNHGRVPGCFLW